MKLLYTMAFSLFTLAAPVATPAQSVDALLLSALCSDDYYEDTADHCNTISAGEVFTLEAILEKCGAIITRDTDDEIVVFYLTDPENIPVGSTYPRGGENLTTQNPIVSEDESSAKTATEQGPIASRVVTPESPMENGDEAADEVTTTGPTARTISASPGRVDDNRAIE